MCGITASVAVPARHLTNGHTNTNTNGHTAASLRTTLQASIAAINHRGPDESGVWISADTSVALGHCRLSINDLSPSGSQPLHSDCGAIHAVVNGEIYDHDRLRAECIADHGYTFHGASDSELVIALYKIHGAPGLFPHLRGEFAFVLYDAREGSARVVAARDRFGIKPMVYGIVDGRLLMAAETKAFLPLGWKPEWDVGAIVSSGWMLDHRTLFKGVHKLLPGHWIELTEECGIETHKYYDAEYEDKTRVETRTIDEMVTGVRERLVESIRLRLRADVPVGVYLSGGIDSSAVAGIVTELAQKNHVRIGNSSATRVACFSVRFPEESGYDESSIAERTAKFLGVEIIKKDVTEATLARDFADTAYHCEHHHFDLNCVAKFALSTLPRDHGVKVVLTGEGADEHFAGYPYFPAEFLREPDLSIPDSPLARKHELRDAMQANVAREMDAIWRNIGAAEGHGLRENEAVTKDTNGSGMPATVVAWHPTQKLFAAWVQKQTESLDCRDTVMASYPADVREKMRTRWHPLHSAQYMWNKSSLANVLLSCLGDRTEMAHSVEARTPFLDHHLTEYVNNLPPSVKLRYTPTAMQDPNQGPLYSSTTSSVRALQSLTEKWILREAVKPYITRELYSRRKHPFLAPTKWPRDGPLHRMFKGLLTKEKVEGLGFVDYGVVEEAVERGFGANAEPKAFRLVVYVGAWVTLAERFGVRKAAEGNLVMN